MAKSDFISDDLANIRERLRRNYRNPDDIVESEDAPAAAPADNPVTISTPGDRSSVRSDFMRDLRETEGRLISTLAQTISEGNMMDFRREKLRELQQELESISAELQKLSVNSNDKLSRGELEALRRRLFQASGTLNGTLPFPLAGADQEKTHEKSSFATVLPVVLAIVFGSLAIAAAILICFN